MVCGILLPKHSCNMVCKKYDLFSNHMHECDISWAYPYTGWHWMTSIRSGCPGSEVIATGTRKLISLSQQNRVAPVGVLLSTTGLVNGSGARDCANGNNFWAGSWFWFGFWYITWTFSIDVPEDWPYKAVNIIFLNFINSACVAYISPSVPCKPTKYPGKMFKALI